MRYRPGRLPVIHAHLVDEERVGASFQQELRGLEVTPPHTAEQGCASRLHDQPTHVPQAMSSVTHEGLQLTPEQA